MGSLKRIESINKIINETNEQEGKQEQIFSWNTIVGELNNNEYYQNQVRYIYDKYFNDPHADYVRYDFLNFDENQYTDAELIMISYKGKKIKYQNFNYKFDSDLYSDLKSKFEFYFNNNNNTSKIPVVIEISKDTNSDIKFYLFFKINKPSDWDKDNDSRQLRRIKYNYKFTIYELLKESTQKDQKNRYLTLKIKDNENNSVFESIQQQINKGEYAKRLINQIRQGDHEIQIGWWDLDDKGSYFTNNVNPYLYFNYIDTGFYINMLLPNKKGKLKYSHITFHTQAGYTNKIHFKFENETENRIIYGTELSIENHGDKIENYFKFIHKDFYNKLHKKTKSCLSEIMKLTQETISIFIFDNLNDDEYYNFIRNANFNQHLIHEYLRRKYTPIANLKKKSELYFYDFEIKNQDQFKNK